MERDMCKYINSLTQSDMSTLEMIISHQYRKFIRFYRLIEDYSELINNVKYEFHSTSSLNVSLVFSSKKGLDGLASTINEQMKTNGYDGDARVDKKTILLRIKLDEGEY